MAWRALPAAFPLLPANSTAQMLCLSLNTPARCWNMLLTSGGKAHHIEFIGGNLKWLKVLAVLQRKLSSLSPVPPAQHWHLRGVEALEIFCVLEDLCFTAVALGVFLVWSVFFYICSVTVILQKIKAVHYPRQKLYLQIYVALLWRDSAASAKLAAADLWPGGCSSVGWN